MVLAAKAVKEEKQTLSSQLEIQVPCWLQDSSSLWVVIKNIDRPGLMSTLPTIDGKGFDMLDLGANAENTAHHLHQYAVLGSFYTKNVRGIRNHVLVCSTMEQKAARGRSTSKGNIRLVSSWWKFELCRKREARDLMNGVADVVVTDGFHETLFLKAIEVDRYGNHGALLKNAIAGGGLRAKLGSSIS